MLWHQFPDNIQSLKHNELEPMLFAIMLIGKVVMMKIIMLSAIMPSVVMLSFILLCETYKVSVC